MTRTNGDLDRTNDRQARKRARMADYRQRTKPARDRVRRLELLRLIVPNGVVR
jgi:hypothetical protein